MTKVLNRSKAKLDRRIKKEMPKRYENTFKKESEEPDYFLYIKPDKGKQRGEKGKLRERPLRMIEEVTVENRDQTQALANCIWSEKERHRDDIEQIERELEALKQKWNVTPLLNTRKL